MSMDMFGKQAHLASLFQTNPVDAAYALGMTAGKKVTGRFDDLDVAPPPELALERLRPRVHRPGAVRQRLAAPEALEHDP